MKGSPRTLLLIIFLVGLVIQLGAAVYKYSQPDELSNNDLTVFITKLLALYSPQLGVIIGGIFAKERVERPRRGRASSVFAVAVTLAVLWNLLLIWRTMAYSFSRNDELANLLKYLDTVSAASSFLIAGAMAYFFAEKKE